MRKTVEIPGDIGVEEGVTGLVKLNQLPALFRRYGRIMVLVVLEVIDTALKKWVIHEEIHNAERATADSDDVQAAVFVVLDDFENFRGATNANDPIRQGEQHAERRLGIKTLADHAAIAQFENVQGKLFAGEKYDAQREEWNAFRPHGSLEE
jgi:hypothetical protein